MVIFEQLKQLRKISVFYYKDYRYSMTYRTTCCNHKGIQFDIPQTVDEATTIEAFEQIKAMENHLKKYPKCKMIRSLID